jgi:hypothetical protein
MKTRVLERIYGGEKSRARKAEGIVGRNESGRI